MLGTGLEDPRAGGGGGKGLPCSGEFTEPLLLPSGLLLGGGGGALVLFDRDMLDPVSTLLILAESSSGFGESRPESFLVSFDSETS